MGIMVISYTIKEITDDVGYLKALGQGRTAEVQRDARIGEAKAKMESSIAEAKVSVFMLRSGQLSRSAHRTPNFMNPEFQFPQYKVLQSVFFFLI